MGEDGVEADVEAVGNLFVGTALDDELEDVGLARREFLVRVGGVRTGFVCQEVLELFEDTFLRSPERQLVDGVRRQVVFVGVNENQGLVAAGEEEVRVSEKEVCVGEVIVEVFILRNRISTGEK